MALNPKELADTLPSEPEKKSPSPQGHLNFPKPTPEQHQATLDNEIKSQFKDRQAGLDYLKGEGANFSDEEKKSFMGRLDRVYPEVKDGNWRNPDRRIWKTPTYMARAYRSKDGGSLYTLSKDIDENGKEHGWTMGEYDYDPFTKAMKKGGNDFAQHVAENGYSESDSDFSAYDETLKQFDANHEYLGDIDLYAEKPAFNKPQPTYEKVSTNDPAYKGYSYKKANGSLMTPNELEWYEKNNTLEGYEQDAQARENAMRAGTPTPQPAAQSQSRTQGNLNPLDDYADEINEAIANKNYGAEIDIMDGMKVLIDQSPRDREETEISIVTENDIIDQFTVFGELDAKTLDSMRDSIEQYLETQGVPSGREQVPTNKLGYKESQGVVMSLQEMSNSPDFIGYLFQNEDGTWEAQNMNDLGLIDQLDEDAGGADPVLYAKVIETPKGKIAVNTEWKGSSEHSSGYSYDEAIKSLIDSARSPQNKSYTAQINNSWEQAKQVLQAKGYDLSKINSTEDIETLMRDLLSKGNGVSNEVWKRDFQETYNALDVGLDKFYNDEYVRNLVKTGNTDQLQRLGYSQEDINLITGTSQKENPSQQ